MKAWFTVADRWCSGQSASSHSPDIQPTVWTFSLLSPSAPSHPHPHHHHHRHQFQVTWTLSTLTEWTLFLLLGDITRLQLVTRPSLSLRHEWMNRCCLVTDPFLSLKGTVRWSAPHGAVFFFFFCPWPASRQCHYIDKNKSKLTSLSTNSVTVDEEKELGHVNAYVKSAVQVEPSSPVPWWRWRSLASAGHIASLHLNHSHMTQAISSTWPIKQQKWHFTLQTQWRCALQNKSANILFLIDFV